MTGVSGRPGRTLVFLGSSAVDWRSPVDMVETISIDHTLSSLILTTEY
jgi:hypothetical protein